MISRLWKLNSSDDFESVAKQQSPLNTSYVRSKWKRLGSIIAVGCVLCLGIVFYIQFFMTRPIGTGPAGPAVNPEPFREVWSTQKVHLLGIGDSVTAGSVRSPRPTAISIACGSILPMSMRICETCV